MRTVDWVDGSVTMIDQRKLPFSVEIAEFKTYEAVAEAIHNMTVRGAPAIGGAAGFGMALAAYQSNSKDLTGFMHDYEKAADVLKDARPTAVNLAWAVDRMLQAAHTSELSDLDKLKQALLDEALKIADEDVAINRQMGANGAELVPDGATILHHCNTGALATVDYGTALGVVRAAHEQGKSIHVLLDETRPRLQGSRLSAWELETLGISYDIIPDTAAGYYMRKGEIDLVLVGADRVAANGDFANKIGTYQVALMAKAHQIPFYTVAPTSTVDLSLANGDLIPIEERDPAEVTTPYGYPIVPAHYKARNPAFDITPHEYLSGIVTEKGVIYAPFDVNLKKAIQG